MDKKLEQIKKRLDISQARLAKISILWQQAVTSPNRNWAVLSKNKKAFEAALLASLKGVLDADKILKKIGGKK